MLFNKLFKIIKIIEMIMTDITEKNETQNQILRTHFQNMILQASQNASESSTDTPISDLTPPENTPGYVVPRRRIIEQNVIASESSDNQMSISNAPPSSASEIKINNAPQVPESELAVTRYKGTAPSPEVKKKLEEIRVQKQQQARTKPSLKKPLPAGNAKQSIEVNFEKSQPDSAEKREQIELSLSAEKHDSGPQIKFAEDTTVHNIKRAEPSASEATDKNAKKRTQAWAQNSSVDKAQSSSQAFNRRNATSSSFARFHKPQQAAPIEKSLLEKPDVRTPPLPYVSGGDQGEDMQRTFSTCERGRKQNPVAKQRASQSSQQSSEVAKKESTAEYKSVVRFGRRGSE